MLRISQSGCTKADVNNKLQISLVHPIYSVWGRPVEVFLKKRKIQFSNSMKSLISHSNWHKSEITPNLKLQNHALKTIQLLKLDIFCHSSRFQGGFFSKNLKTY